MTLNTLTGRERGLEASGSTQHVREGGREAGDTVSTATGQQQQRVSLRTEEKTMSQKREGSLWKLTGAWILPPARPHAPRIAEGTASCRSEPPSVLSLNAAVLGSGHPTLLHCHGASFLATRLGLLKGRGLGHGGPPTACPKANPRNTRTWDEPHRPAQWAWLCHVRRFKRAEGFIRV